MKLRRTWCAVAVWLLLGASALAATGQITVIDGGVVPTRRTYNVTIDGSGNYVGNQAICDGASATPCAGVNGVGLKVDASGATLTVSGSVSITGTPSVSISGTPTVTLSASSVTANAGTNLNTSALALDASVNGILLSQGSTTSGQKGPLAQGAVTTAAPSYTTAQTSPLSLNASGGLRVDGSGVTQPVSQSGTWTVQPGNTANTTPWLVTVNDGTNSAKVQAASANAAQADKALVVAPSPNPSTVCTAVKPISQTASTDLVTSTNKLHICGYKLISATAQNLSLVEGTGSTCGTGTAALDGATTAANGSAVAANGGWGLVSERPFMVTQTTADHLCLLQSGSGLVAGFISYIDHN
jgi:hypothetical protein